MTVATRETLKLLASELVTNAVLHAGLGSNDPVTLDVTTQRDRVRLAVHDDGPGFAAPSAEGADPLAPGGRGCVIVDALADAWGIDRDAGGCTVWCEVGIAEPPDDHVDRAVTDAYLRHLVGQLATARLSA